jgi:hypothetical protein
MLESSRLLRVARKYNLSTPDFHADPDSDPHWRQGTSFKPTWYLKRQAMDDLRTRVRAERKARREPILEWVKVVGGSGGLVYLIEKVVKLFIQSIH